MYKHVVYIDSFARLVFFLSIRCVYKAPKQVLFVTFLPEISALLRRRGYECHLIHKGNGDLSHTTRSEEYQDLGQVERHYKWTPHEIDHFIDELQRIVEKSPNATFYVWNSAFLPGQFLKTTKSRALFFENSNIDRNVYVSYSGTNAEAKIDEILEPSEVADLFLPQHLPTFTFHEKILFAIQRLWKLHRRRFYSYRGVSLISKLLDRSLGKVILGNISTSTLPSNFVFIPLQISDDTNVISYFQGGIEDFLKDCSKDYNDRALVAKFHPKDNHFFLKLRILKRWSGRITFTGNDIGDILYNECEVATINSTVGFEALLEGKSVAVYGESYYKGLEPVEVLEVLRKFRSGLKLP